MDGTNQEKAVEKSTSKSARIVGLVLLGLIVVLLIASIVAAWMMQQLYKYYVQSPSDRAQREALVAQVTKELEHWRELDKTKEGHAMAADDDRQWPLDRLPVVLAIENYYLKNGKLPPNIEALNKAGLLPDPALAKRFRVMVKNDKWELRASSEFLTAVGN